MYRKIKIRKICDGITTHLNLKDYVMFENNYILKEDAIIYNQNDEPYIILDFKEIYENTLVIPSILPYSDGYAIKKYSCVKLNKSVNINDIFHIKK